MKFATLSLALLSVAFAATEGDKSPEKAEPNQQLLSSLKSLTSNLISDTEKIAHMGGVNLDKMINISGLSISSEAERGQKRDNVKDYKLAVTELLQHLLNNTAAILGATGNDKLSKMVQSVEYFL